MDAATNHRIFKFRFEDTEVQFSSNFDSGNLFTVEQLDPLTVSTTFYAVQYHRKIGLRTRCQVLLVLLGYWLPHGNTHSNSTQRDGHLVLFLPRRISKGQKT